MYPHVTQFETLDGRRRLALASWILAPEHRGAHRHWRRLGRRRRAVAGGAPGA